MSRRCQWLPGEMREKHLQVLDGGDPSESLTRNSLNLILAQVPGEREMRKRKREILGFVWSHFTFREKASWGRWTVCCRPSGTIRRCFEVWNHIVLLTINVTSSFIRLAFYHSVSLCVCVGLMKNISKAVLCNERPHSGMRRNRCFIPVENEAIIRTLSNPRKQTDVSSKSSSTPKLMSGIF